LAALSTDLSDFVHWGGAFYPPPVAAEPPLVNRVRNSNPAVSEWARVKSIPLIVDNPSLPHPHIDFEIIIVTLPIVGNE
jgi:hypothetical protein